MRIWHKKLLPYLCNKHLIACWREALGAFSIITKNKKGYSKHPAVLEFKEHIADLWVQLHKIRHEMIKRGLKPKSAPLLPTNFVSKKGRREWQTLKQQIEILKFKKCSCKIPKNLLK